MNEQALINELKKQLENEIIKNAEIGHQKAESPTEIISRFNAEQLTKWFHELKSRSDTNPSMKSSHLDTRFDILKNTRSSLIKFGYQDSIILFDSILFEFLNSFHSLTENEFDDIEFVETILHTVNYFAIADKSHFTENTFEHILFRLLKDKNLLKLQKKYYSLHTVLIDTITYYTWSSNGVIHIKNELISQINYIKEPNFYVVLLRFMFKNVNPNNTFLYADFLKAFCIIYFKLCQSARTETSEYLDDVQGKLLDIIQEFLFVDGSLTVDKIKTISKILYCISNGYSSYPPEAICIENKIRSIFTNFLKIEEFSSNEQEKFIEIFGEINSYNFGGISKKDIILGIGDESDALVDEYI